MGLFHIPMKKAENLVEEKNKDYVKENIPAKEVNIASPRQRIKIKKMWFEDEDTGEIKI